MKKYIFCVLIVSIILSIASFFLPKIGSEQFNKNFYLILLPLIAGTISGLFLTEKRIGKFILKSIIGLVIFSLIFYIISVAAPMLVGFGILGNSLSLGVGLFKTTFSIQALIIVLFGTIFFGVILMITFILQFIVGSLLAYLINRKRSQAKTLGQI